MAFFCLACPPPRPLPRARPLDAWQARANAARPQGRPGAGAAVARRATRRGVRRRTRARRERRSAWLLYCVQRGIAFAGVVATTSRETRLPVQSKRRNDSFQATAAKYYFLTLQDVLALDTCGAPET
eukprot:IDg2346t1